jgi:glycosyltransferase involved in cell wall biosynthesis
MQKKIVHMTSVHGRYDVRIFKKECQSLAKKYHVCLIVADGLGDEIKSGVTIYDVGKSSGRIGRMLRTTRRIYEKAKSLNADIYHAHDPELLPKLMKLQRLGTTKSVYDAHEDLPRQLLSKAYGNKFTLKILSWLSEIYLLYAMKKVNMVAATPHIHDVLSSKSQVSVNINNYPILEEFLAPVESTDIAKDKVCYVGGLFRTRGILECVNTASFLHPEIKIEIAGDRNNNFYLCDLEKYQEQPTINFLGFLNRDEVAKLYGESFAGLVLLHPTPAYTQSLPVKMFEYMAANIPVIASDFPLWRQILIEGDCGICVDPMDIGAIAKAINFLYDHPETVKNMGERGRRLVETKYNWGIEERKLFLFYDRLLG